MASPQKLLRLYLLTSTIFFCLTSPSPCQKVTLSVYYETLCPYCADFIANHLIKVFQTGLISMVDLRLVPWGNALIRPDGAVACQHGQAECFLNTIEACAINTYPDVEKHFGFVYCIERLALLNKLDQWVDCLEMAGLSKAPIDCYNSRYGYLLEQRYAEETFDLNPPHKFVPWVVVNNQPLQEDYQNFVMYICNAYGGNQNQVPEACTTFNSPEEKTSVSRLACYANN